MTGPVALRTARESLAYIVGPTAVFYIATGFDWRLLLVAPVMWFFGFAHGAISTGRAVSRRPPEEKDLTR